MSDTPRAPEKRAVASSFIFRLPADGAPARVALFRRSAKVRTYQHKYAPVSGSVDAADADALATAWRELREETGLTEPALRLVRRGKPYSFVDASVGREWTVNPFAFALAQGVPDEAVRIDWEHESFAWFDPADVPADDEAAAGFEGVPRLRESLRRVWFELDLGRDAAAVLDVGLDDLRNDHASGARQLASRALEAFAGVMARLDRAASAEHWWRSLRLAAWHLWKNGRETMGASVLGVLVAALAAIEARLPAGAAGPLPQGLVDEALSALGDVTRARVETGAKIQRAFADFVRQRQAGLRPPAGQADGGAFAALRILTLSASSTVSSCLVHAIGQGVPLDIHVLESRPLCEGVAMAQSVAASCPEAGNARVSVHTDASAALAARDAHLVLLGADLIDHLANVSNKTGSLPAVLAARHASPGVKVVAVAEKDKILPFDPPLGLEHNDPAEVTRAWVQPSADAVQAAGVHVSNVYFEWVPASLIDHYITEDAVTTTGEVAAWASTVKVQAERFFSDI